MIHTSVIVDFSVSVTVSGGWLEQYSDAVTVVVLKLGGGTAQYPDEVTVRVLVSVTGGEPPYPHDGVTVVVSVLVEMTVDTLEEGGGSSPYPPEDD